MVQTFQFGLILLTEELSKMQNDNNDIDVNLVVTIYNQKISNLINQNVILEAKLQSLLKTFSEEKNSLLMANLDLQKKVDSLLNEKKTSKAGTKYEDSGVE